MRSRPARRRRSRWPFEAAFSSAARPVHGDFARRFVACAAESGIDVFRLHDPLNDVENLKEAAEAIVGADREFDAGLLYGSGRHVALVEAGRRLPELGATRILLHDPAALMQPHRAAELVCRAARGVGPARRDLLPGRRRQCAGGGARGRPCGRRPDRHRASIPVALALHRVSTESATQALAGLKMDTGVDLAAVWRATELVDEHIGDEPVSPVAPASPCARPLTITCSTAGPARWSFCSGKIARSAADHVQIVRSSSRTMRCCTRALGIPPRRTTSRCGSRMTG